EGRLACKYTTRYVLVIVVKQNAVKGFNTSSIDSLFSRCVKISSLTELRQETKCQKCYLLDPDQRPSMNKDIPLTNGINIVHLINKQTAISGMSLNEVKGIMLLGERERERERERETLIKQSGQSYY
ncbi:hypothetical protein LSH36_132g05068, partial [Paralvinella palmiformis]